MVSGVGCQAKGRDWNWEVGKLENGAWRRERSAQKSDDGWQMAEDR